MTFPQPICPLPFTLFKLSTRPFFPEHPFCSCGVIGLLGPVPMLPVSTGPCAEQLCPGLRTCASDCSSGSRSLRTLQFPVPTVTCTFRLLVWDLSQRSNVDAKSGPSLDLECSTGYGVLPLVDTPATSSASVTPATSCFLPEIVLPPNVCTLRIVLITY